MQTWTTDRHPTIDCTRLFFCFFFRYSFWFCPCDMCSVFSTRFRRRFARLRTISHCDSRGARVVFLKWIGSAFFNALRDFRSQGLRLPPIQSTRLSPLSSVASVVVCRAAAPPAPLITGGDPRKMTARYVAHTTLVFAVVFCQHCIFVPAPSLGGECFPLGRWKPGASHLTTHEMKKAHT